MTSLWFGIRHRTRSPLAPSPPPRPEDRDKAGNPTFKEGPLVPIAALRHMMRETPQDNAGETSHGSKLSRSDQQSQFRGYCTCHRNSSLSPVFRFTRSFSHTTAALENFPTTKITIIIDKSLTIKLNSIPSNANFLNLISVNILDTACTTINVDNKKYFFRKKRSDSTNAREICTPALIITTSNINK